jgi:hypothetical protein
VAASLEAAQAHAPPRDHDLDSPSLASASPGTDVARSPRTAAITATDDRPDEPFMRVTWTIVSCVATWLGSSVAAASDTAAGPATTSPATTSPATTGPATTSPATTSPATTSPATTSPATTSPAPTSPATTSPAPTGPASNEHTQSGLIDLGASFGLLVASGVRDVTIAPSIGWFVADNVEVAAVASVTSVKAADQSATVWSTLVEPSYHLPLNATTFGVLGMAVGAAYEHTLGTGLAVAPRIGLSVAVGRHGVLTAALSYDYITHSAEHRRTEAALIAITSALRVHIGYAVRW